jgi:hypothetical protein
MKINVTQSALDAAASEATFHFISTGRMIVDGVNETDRIIAKHLPAFIPAAPPFDTNKCVFYWYRMYTNFDTMCAASPYGGEDIAWPACNYMVNWGSSTNYIPTTESLEDCRSVNMVSNTTTNKRLNDTASGAVTPSGMIFVFTVVCNYPFSSALTKKLFHGGVNTIRVGNKQPGTRYLLWARGVGITN